MERELADALETAWLNDASGAQSILLFTASEVIRRLRAGGIGDATIRNTLLTDAQRTQ